MLHRKKLKYKNQLFIIDKKKKTRLKYYYVGC